MIYHFITIKLANIKKNYITSFQEDMGESLFSSITNRNMNFDSLF